MGLLYKTGWVRWAFGAIFLSALIWQLEILRRPYYQLHDYLLLEEFRELSAIGWIALGLVGEFALAAGFLLIGTALLPMQFFRWTFARLATWNGIQGWPLIIAGALLAGGLEEILFRVQIQTELTNELGEREGLFVTAAIFAVYYWTPVTNLISLWTFGRGLVYGYLFLKTGNPWVPIVVRFVSEGAFLFGVTFLSRAGLVREPPEKLRPVEDEERQRHEPDPFKGIL